MIGADVNSIAQENPYREFTYTLASAAQIKIEYAFDIFRVLALTTGASLGVKFSDSGSETNWSGSGLGYSPPSILPNVTLRNTGGTTLTVTVALGIGDIKDDRVNITSSSGSIPVVSQSPSTLETAADVTLTASGIATLLLTTNTARRKAIIGNNSMSDFIRIGDASVSATRGVRVAPNQTIEIDSTEAIYGASETAATPSVSIMWSET